MRRRSAPRQQRKASARASQPTNDERRPRREEAAGATWLASRWTPALIVFAVALGLRLVNVVQIERAPFFSILLGDSLGYDAWAQRIAAGDWAGKGVFYQAPLYPYMLGTLYALFGRSLMLVRVVQALLGAAACALLTTAGGRLFGRRAGAIAGLLLAGYAPAIFFDGLLQKSVLDGFFLCWLLLAIALLLERVSLARCLWAGAALGLLALTRENALLLAPLLLAWLWLRGRRALVPLLAFAVGLAAVLTPAALRNLVVGGELHLTTAQLGPNLYIGNNERATGSYVALRHGHGNAADEQHDATEMAEAAIGRTLTPAEVSDYWRDRALAWISDHPGRWMALTVKKFLLAFNRAETVDTEDIASHAEYSLPLRLTGAFLNFGVIAPLGLLGMWMTRRRWRELWVFPAMCGVYVASVVLFYVLARYRYPLVAILILFAGAALTSLPAWWRRTAARERWSTAAVLAVVTAVCNWPLVASASMQALTHYNVGYALQEQGRLDEAAAEYRAALVLQPHDPDAHTNLGVLLAAQGRHEEALQHYREAVESDPASAEAQTNIGIELAALGRQSEALSAFRQAVEIDRENAPAAYNLGTALAGAGDLDGAIRWFSTAARLDPQNFGAHNNLGIALASTGRLREAVEQFRAALAIRPDDAQAQANLDRAEAMASAPR